MPAQTATNNFNIRFLFLDHLLWIYYLLISMTSWCLLCWWYLLSDENSFRKLFSHFITNISFIIADDVKYEHNYVILLMKIYDLDFDGRSEMFWDIFYHVFLNLLSYFTGTICFMIEDSKLDVLSRNASWKYHMNIHQ